MPFTSINPTTEALIARYPALSNEALRQKIVSSNRAFQEIRNLSFAVRAKALDQVAVKLQQNKGNYATLMVQEMGKTYASAEAEVEKCAWVCRYYAEHGEHFLQPQVVKTDAKQSYVSYEPLGVILGIMPWNFPFWQVLRFVAPTLMAGNAILIKHAPNVPQCALALENLFQEVGLPTASYQNLFIELEQVESVIAHDAIQAISLTGSVRAGQAVASLAGKYIKKCVLELGGSDPFIVLSDAAIDLAVSVGIQSRFLNNGQSCIAAKRFILEASIVDIFTEKFLDAVKKLHVGNPMEHTTDIGPMARADLRQQLDLQVQKTLQQGASCLIGGKAKAGKGFFYEPTILGNVTPNMCAFQEEIFGPVATLTPAKDATEAITLANQTSYGLGATLMTQDTKKAQQLISQIQAGNVFVNGIVKSDPRLPFGGIKKSGYGRELSQAGIQEFVNKKTVWVK